MKAVKALYTEYMKKIHILSLLLILITAVSCGKKKEQEIEEVLRPVKVQVLSQSDMSLGYSAGAEIKGKEEIPYVAVVSGELTVLNGKNGDRVNAGQVILGIDNQAARSNVQSAAASYNAARIQYEKYSQLYQKRLITETEYLNAKTNYQSAGANLALANDNNSKSVIKADVNGVISGLDLERHQQINAGQFLFKIVNESEMEIKVGVSPNAVSKIKIGTDAKIKIDELDREVSGKVYEISGAADVKTRQFTVKIRIPNPDREIKSGMYGTANINTGVEKGIIIPKESIVVRGVEQIVYIVQDGAAKAIPIKILNQNEKFAAVEGEGLTVGMEIVTDGQNVVQNGEKVKKVN
ncbi:MAG: efflux RND transporter periplasmic adaptor subunit [Leptotrichiaceae bacterium]|nr:efflux RND transporter periplasmic adaptor subunit [Leptotrichiaceae bacterium]